MKPLYLILLLFPFLLHAQPYRSTYSFEVLKTNRVYSTDTANSTPTQLMNKDWFFRHLPSLTSDILDFQGNKYAPYYSRPACLGFYTDGTWPSNNGTLGLTGGLLAFKFQGHSSEFSGSAGSFISTGNLSTGVYGSGTSIGVRGYSETGNAAYLEQDGNPNKSLLYLKRTPSLSNENINADIIEISDNPTTTGTIAGKILTAKIGTTERIAFNPRVANGSTAIAYLFDTEHVLTGTAKLLSLKNAGSENFYVTGDGKMSSSSVTTNIITGGQTTLSLDASINGYALCLKSSTTNRAVFFPNVTDGISAVAYTFDTNNSLSNASARLISIRNAGSEKALMDKDGQYENTTAGNGIILKSPDGTRYKITVANGGTLTVTAL